MNDRLLWYLVFVLFCSLAGIVGVGVGSIITVDVLDTVRRLFTLG